MRIRVQVTLDVEVDDDAIGNQRIDRIIRDEIECTGNIDLKDFSYIDYSEIEGYHEGSHVDDEIDLLKADMRRAS